MSIDIETAKQDLLNLKEEYETRIDKSAAICHVVYGTCRIIFNVYFKYVSLEITF